MSVPVIKERYAPDLIIANLENAAGGFGVNDKAFDELQRSGVQFFTSGNHIWDKKEGVALLNAHNNIVRPANYPGSSDGVGSRVITVNGTPVGIFNVQGRVFMQPIECPFRTMDQLLTRVGDSVKVRIVDMHAEATSEKKAMGWYLDGRVSAVLGTHTHVRTGDAEVLPQGTAFVTDVGMTGANDSILGINKDVAIRRFLEMRPVRFEVARDDLRIDFVILDIDEGTGKARNIEHVQLKAEQ